MEQVSIETTICHKILLPLYNTIEDGTIELDLGHNLSIGKVNGHNMEQELERLINGSVSRPSIQVEGMDNGHQQ